MEATEGHGGLFVEGGGGGGGLMGTFPTPQAPGMRDRMAPTMNRKQKMNSSRSCQTMGADTTSSLKIWRRYLRLMYIIRSTTNSVTVTSQVTVAMLLARCSLKLELE